MIVLDFYGLHGVGKSTFILALMDELHARGITYKDRPFYPQTASAFQKLIIMIKPLLSLKEFGFNAAVLLYMLKGRFGVHPIIWAFHAMIKCNYYLRKAMDKKEYDVLIFDEGFIQQPARLDKRIEGSDFAFCFLCREIKKRYSENFFICCAASDEEWIRRRRNRRRKNGQTDPRGKEEKWICSGRIMKQNFQAVKCVITPKKSIELNLERNAKENIRIIITAIEPYLKKEQEKEHI